MGNSAATSFYPGMCVPDVKELRCGEVITPQRSGYGCCKIEQPDFEFLDRAISKHKEELDSEVIAEIAAQGDSFDWLLDFASKRVESREGIDEPVHDDMTLLSLASLAGRLAIVTMLQRACFGSPGVLGFGLGLRAGGFPPQDWHPRRCQGRWPPHADERGDPFP